MENQHRKIKGYRELSQEEINDMNDIKSEGERLKNLIEALRARGNGLDQRWVDISETHLQQGIMALVRSVAKPESF
ncbi:hypothetical protein ACOCGN_003252 [Vibrio cholerae]